MSLRANDLKYMMEDIFEIDSYGSKMGADEDVVTLSFSLLEKEPAEDLVHFLEAGYPFILDADVSPGELDDGKYKVFIEIERGRDIANHIYEMLDGVRKISGINNLKYRYYKNFKSQEATMENLNLVPSSANEYLLSRETITMENYKNFFADSYLEECVLQDDILTMRKAFAEPLQFRVVDFGDADIVYHSLNESYNINGFEEVLFLTKYLGEYSISKYGNKTIFERYGKMLVTERISC